jgi:hypothetical protein
MDDIERQLAALRAQITAAEAKPDQLNAIRLPSLRDQEARLQAILDRGAL